MAGFEPAIPEGERPQTHVLDRADTGIGIGRVYLLLQKQKNLECLSATSVTVELTAPGRCVTQGGNTCSPLSEGPFCIISDDTEDTRVLRSYSDRTVNPTQRFGRLLCGF
jgi:hypothetical protein